MPKREMFLIGSLSDSIMNSLSLLTARQGRSISHAFPRYLRKSAAMVLDVNARELFYKVKIIYREREW